MTMPSILENLNALLAGTPILRDPKDVLYHPRTATPPAKPTPQHTPVGPDRYRYYSDTGSYTYKRFDE
jgi:hypothetical protein